MEPCPSTFALDDREIHGAPPGDPVGRHLASCARCTGRLTSRAALADRFAAEVDQPLWRHIATAPRRPRLWPLAWLAPTLAIAAVILVVRPRTTPDGQAPASSYRAAKGDPGVAVAGRRAGRVFSFGAGVEALPGDEIELTVPAARPEDAFVLVGSVDASGAFSPFYPPTLDAHSVPLPRAGAPLAPPIVLDAAPGPERIVVVRSARPVSVSAIAPLARAAAARGERFAVPDDASAHVSSIVVPKGTHARPAAGGP